MKKTIYGLIAIALSLNSCTSEPVIIKQGETFAFDEQNLTVNLTCSSVMNNHDELSTIIAPEGKAYLKVDVKAENDTYFLSVKDGESEVTEVDYLIAKNFVDKIDVINMDPNKSKLYLVDISNANYKVHLKTYGDEIATLDVGQLEDKGADMINPAMLDFLIGFEDGTNLSTIVKQFIPMGADVYEYIFETGMDVPSDPIVKGLKISYASDKNTYKCTSEFGVDQLTVIWSGDAIEKVVFD